MKAIGVYRRFVGTGLLTLGLSALVSVAGARGPEDAALKNAGATATKATAEKAAAEAAAEKRAAEKAAAEKTLAEKVAVAKQAAEAVSNARVAAIKAAAHRAALQEIARRRAEINAVAASTTQKDAPALKAFADQALEEKIAHDKQAAEKAATEKAAAEKDLAEREAALKKVTEDAAAAEHEAKTAPDNKELAQKAAAAKGAVDRVDGERVRAANTLRSKDYTARRASERVKLGADVLAVIAASKRPATEVQDPAAKKKQQGEAQKAAQTIDGFTRTAITEAIDRRRLAHESAVSGKAAAERTLQQKIAAVAAAAAKATAMQAAQQDLQAKDAEIKVALARFYEAQSLVDGGLKPLAADQWDCAKARHLLCRAGFGGTPDEVEKLYAMGLHQAVDYLVDYHQQPDLHLPFDAQLPPRALADESRLDEQRRIDLNTMRRRVDQQQQARLRDWWLQRMVQSPRPLQEKLVLFWHGHFATEYRTVNHSYAMFQQNDLFREHAAGNFGALLHGIVHDPAMLRYLDNNSNVKGRPNENLAREIMELFSMGEGNYTEEDIMEGARALTGYTYDHYTSQFRFIVSRHDTGEKTIFGRKGNFAGDDFVDLILQQPFTPQFIARKLLVYFAHENPEPEVVHRLATVLNKNQYELGPTLKNLFMSEVFYGPESIATQIKSPVQLMVGTLRDLGIKEVSYASLGSYVANMGHELFGPPNVRGWEGGRFWVDANRIFVRYNAVADLIETISVPGQPRGLDVVGALAGKQFNTPAEVVDYLAKGFFVRRLEETKREKLTEYLGSLPPSSQWESRRSEVNTKLRALLVLLVSMPEYQCS